MTDLKMMNEHEKQSAEHDKPKNNDRARKKMRKQMREKSRVYIKYGLFAVLYGLLGAYSYRLYLRQAIQYPGPLGNYMPIFRHISRREKHIRPTVSWR